MDLMKKIKQRLDDSMSPAFLETLGFLLGLIGGFGITLLALAALA